MGYKITIKQGNLLEEENATFIVNASNTKLLLGSGVSFAFKRHCGRELQDVMNNAYKLIKHLEKGDVVFTGSAKAKNFEYTIHGAIMDYNKGVRGNEKLPSIMTIKNILYNIESSLQKYIKSTKEQNIKLVIPLLGCGMGGLDKNNVIRTYFDFFSRTLDFDMTCEVVIYGYSSEDFKLLARYKYLQSKVITQEQLIYEYKNLLHEDKNECLIDISDLDEIINSKYIFMENIQYNYKDDNSSYQAMKTIVDSFSGTKIIETTEYSILFFIYNPKHLITKIVGAMDVLMDKQNDESSVMFFFLEDEKQDTDSVKIVLFFGCN